MSKDMQKYMVVPRDPISRKLDFSRCTRDVLFRLTKNENRNSWMAWIKEGNEDWRQLRPAETTFESAQAAIYDEMIAWAFPR